MFSAFCGFSRFQHSTDKRLSVISGRHQPARSGNAQAADGENAFYGLAGSRTPRFRRVQKRAFDLDFDRIQGASKLRRYFCLWILAGVRTLVSAGGRAAAACGMMLNHRLPSFSVASSRYSRWMTLGELPLSNDTR